MALIRVGFLLLGLLSCNCNPAARPTTSQQVNADTKPALNGKTEAATLPDNQQKPDAASGIAPGHCRIRAMVTAISPQPEAGVPGICGQVPCQAKVKILKIIVYGPQFNQTLTENQEINAYFTYSLKPTAQLVPDLTTPLPGLKVNSVFIADIPASSKEAGNSMSWYQIGIYQVE